MRQVHKKMLKSYFFMMFISGFGGHQVLANHKKQTQSPDVFYKKAVIKNFTISTGTHLCWSIFLLLFFKEHLPTTAFGKRKLYLPEHTLAVMLKNNNLFSLAIIIKVFPGI